jgi:hypothetical protein
MGEKGNEEEEEEEESSVSCPMGCKAGERKLDRLHPRHLTPPDLVGENLEVPRSTRRYPSLH